jgi:hypothetical protein
VAAGEQVPDPAALATQPDLAKLDPVHPKAVAPAGLQSRFASDRGPQLRRPRAATATAAQGDRVESTGTTGGRAARAPAPDAQKPFVLPSVLRPGAR